MDISSTVLNAQAFQIKFNTFQFYNESGFLAAPLMRCVTVSKFLEFSELFSFHFEQYLPLINVKSCVVFSCGFYFFSDMSIICLLNAYLFPSIMLLICVCLFMSLGLSPILMLHISGPGKMPFPP
uniref:Uncharacterized protein n=1 Tax=Pipistrellus kuhlii TaxID=59472 RepID=A0A7J8A8Q2_PIPKU|nr:hypothetical protein mPipKuh1_008997 [Pipistrellus kuhlii]